MLQAWTIIIVLLSYQNKSCNWKLTSQIEIKSNFPNYVLIGATKHTNSINSQSVWTKSCVIETFYSLSCLNTLSEIQSYVCNSQIASYLIVFVLPIACFIKGKSASSDKDARTSESSVVDFNYHITWIQNHGFFSMRVLKHWDRTSSSYFETQLRNNFCVSNRRNQERSRT